MSLTDVIVSFFDRRGDEFYTEPELAEFILESDWLNEQLAEAWEAGATAGFENASLPTPQWESNPHRPEES